jgi:hypothetical protein
MTLTQQETEPITLEEPSATDEPATAVVEQRPSRWATIPGLLFTMFGVDLRSLAVFRIVLGLVMLQDLLGRWSEVELHYSDRGLLSREQVLDALNVWRWSLYFVNGTTEFGYLMFAITMVTCLAVIVGYRTRLAMVVLWILLVSLQVRNSLVLSGADSFLRLLMFWAMFLPLGAVWSVDQRLARGTPAPRPWYVSVASAALLLQIAFVYLFTALLKTGEEWRSDFTALFYALGAKQLTTPIGDWLHQFPDLMRVLTASTMVVEVAMPIIVFVPWKNARMRCAGIVMIVGLQIGIMLTMNIGIFPWISTFCMVCFLPTVVWDRVLGWTSRLVRERLPALRNRWQGIWGRGAATSADSSRVVRASLFTNLAAALLLVIVLGWNVASVSSYSMPRESRPAVYGLAVYQKWSMFAPRPPRSTQWSVVVGTLEGGQQVNLLPSLVEEDMSLVVPLSWDRPEYIGGDYYGNKYWRKYFSALDEDSRSGPRRSMAGYLCRNWNAEHDGPMQLATVELYSVLEPTILEEGDDPQRRIERSSHRCT